jgi:23S rRNA U2552 (ribose-2'-O)-methylase RlmE/FtsJ
MTDNPLYRRFLEGRTDSPKLHKWHHYFDVYHAELAAFRGKPVRMLEIGVQQGGSLRMWQEYLGPQARIFGMDIDPATARHALPGGKVFIGDQADQDFLRRCLEETGPLDIVIDDGGHTMRQMINSFEVLYPTLNKPGVYIVEDTHTAFWGGSFADHPQRKTVYDLAFQVCKRLQEWTGQAANFNRLAVPPDQRGAALPASRFCRETDSVHFFDSMIVFRRTTRPEPWREVR